MPQNPMTVYVTQSHDCVCNMTHPTFMVTQLVLELGVQCGSCAKYYFTNQSAYTMFLCV